ncbi:hypothetical protein Afil01_49110 [Actinorhabdospora filicis]|uniref:Uncharacterized protein n=1 Tax=Actinorhabdospora filicis TaxID=1785913 RepID=A0A9W6WAY2_9ACTN|nr:hypothetical protein [Actinorhabdospora filicis]GLZ80104.1 hypothetical protein Afil01_49110 [Actinorhabdospora filicis]
MTVVDRLTGRLIARAALNWPEEMREDMTGEWNAEIHAIGNDPERGTLSRAWRRLRFGASLAATPPVDEPPGFFTRLREATPGGARRLAPLLAMTIAVLLLPQLAEQFPAFTTGYFGERTETEGIHAAAWPILLTANLLALALSAVFGALAFRCAPVSRRRPLLNAIAPVVIALLAIAFVGPRNIGNGYYFPVLAFERTPLVVLVLGGSGLLCAGLVLIARRRRAIAAAVTVAGGLIIIDLAGMALSMPYLFLTGAGPADMIRLFPEAMVTTTFASASDTATLATEAAPALRQLATLIIFGLAYAFAGIHGRFAAAPAARPAAPARREGLWLAWGALPVSIAVAFLAFTHPMPDPAYGPGIGVWNLRAASVTLVLLAALLSIPGGRVLKAGLGVVAAIMTTVLLGSYPADASGPGWDGLVLAIGALFAVLAWAGAVSARRAPLPTWTVWAAPAAMAAAVAAATVLQSDFVPLYTWFDGLSLIFLVVVVQCATGVFRWWHLALSAVLAPLVGWPVSQLGQIVVQPLGPGLYRLFDIEHGYGGPPVLAGLLLGLALAVLLIPVTSAPPPSPRPAPLH